MRKHGILVDNSDQGYDFETQFIQAIGQTACGVAVHSFNEKVLEGFREAITWVITHGQQGKELLFISCYLLVVDVKTLGKWKEQIEKQNQRINKQAKLGSNWINELCDNVPR